ncbi:3-keto-disaccharide hydrolase [Alteromonas halophila]|uniref:Large, multifunctional secreted protein n=1 Tax=Alteromonas halophila TaxID=516698 RepID=A0A918MY61_9ALTE|nr:DUF1080 domain-containing protein [Alteromonas halophila]GGW83734.1 large, multifunctional secreted protein [Alteromonas halophila]
MQPTLRRVVLGTIVAGLTGSALASNDQLTREQQAAKTEVWEPVPEVVSAPPNQPPSDAIVLFNGEDLSAWESVKQGAAEWQVKDGVMTVKPGTGDIKTRQAFCDIQLHMEWRTPSDVEGLEGQQRNNSGVFFQQRYEVQILDSYDNKTYPNGQAGAVYKQHIPLVNAMRAPGEWQTYDILYTAPEFSDGELTSPAYITVLHNGVVIQHHVEVQGKTEWIGAPSYEAHGCAPLQLQDHSNPVSFRNIWVREL